MSTQIDDGGPAFPRATSLDGDGHMQSETQYGMSLRDYFAAKALQALIAKMPLHDAEGEHGIQSTKDANGVIYREIADSAYWYADAMLAERAKPRTP